MEIAKKEGEDPYSQRRVGRLSMSVDLRLIHIKSRTHNGGQF